MFGILKNYTVQLCPEVQGRVTLNGKPIPHLEVARSLTYPEDEMIDTATTDEEGYFHFESKSMKSRLPGNILHNPVIRQIISVVVDDKEYLFWYANQKSINTYPIFAERLKNLNAELTTPELEHDLENEERPDYPHGVFSICRW